MMRMATIGAGVLGICLAAQVSEAGQLTTWHVPFSNSQLFQVTAGAAGVSYVDFDGGGTGTAFLGVLDTANGKFREMMIPFFVGSGDLRVRPADGAVFLTDSTTGDLGQGDIGGRQLRRWTLPDGAGIRSFVLADTGLVLFLGGTPEGRMLIGRLVLATGAVTTWPLPDSMALPGDDLAWRIVQATTDTVIVNVNGFAHPGQLVRLDLATGVFTSWVTPAAPVFPLVADAAGSIYFQEIAGGVRRVARLIPTTGQLTEWNFPNADVEFLGEMALESGQLMFGFGNPAGLAALDPSTPGDESVLLPFSETPVAPSTAVISPIVTARLRTRVGVGRPAAATFPATAQGAFTTWDVGTLDAVLVGNGTGSGTVFGDGDFGGPAIFRFVR